jgi:hypothetical protein
LKLPFGTNAGGIALENALLLHAAAWNVSERDRPQFLAARDFALRLLAP